MSELMPAGVPSKRKGASSLADYPGNPGAGKRKMLFLRRMDMAKIWNSFTKSRRGKRSPPTGWHICFHPFVEHEAQTPWLVLCHMAMIPGSSFGHMFAHPRRGPWRRMTEGLPPGYGMICVPFFPAMASSSRWGWVMMTSRPPLFRKSMAASILGPMLPAGNWPSSR